MKIRSICADLFGFDSGLHWDDPIAIRIEFSNALAVRLRCASDGESLVIDDKQLDGPVDMAEAGWGETCDLACRLDDTVIAAEVTSLNRVLDGNNIAVALTLLSDHKPIFCVWNWGDQLHYGSFDTMAALDWGAVLRISPNAYV